MPKWIHEDWYEVDRDEVRIISEDVGTLDFLTKEFEMDKYKDLIDKLLAAVEETAKLTSNTWDDVAAAAARTVFERIFVRPLVGAVSESELVHHEMGSAAVGAVLPSWALPLLIELATQLLKLLNKKD